MGMHRVVDGTPWGPLSPYEDKDSREAIVLFVGVVLSVPEKTVGWCVSAYPRCVFEMEDDNTLL
jgi:hypothetical protein